MKMLTVSLALLAFIFFVEDVILLPIAAGGYTYYQCMDKVLERPMDAESFSNAQMKCHHDGIDAMSKRDIFNIYGE